MERQPIKRPELSEQFLTEMAYFNFIKLAQTYGKDPSRNQDVLDLQLSPLLNENTRTLIVLIPADSSQGYGDLISGVDYENNILKVFYRKGEVAANVTLSLNEKTKTVKMQTDTVYKVNKSKKNHPTYDPADKTKTKASIYAIKELLEKAEPILETQERERITVLGTPRKISFRKRLYLELIEVSGKLPPINP